MDLGQLASEITYCNDTQCPRKDTCRRYVKSTETHWIFTYSPRVDGAYCPMYWGSTQDAIMNTLLEAVGSDERL